MNPTCVDSVLQDLSKLETHRLLTPQMEAQLKTLKMESRFLQMHLWCLAKWKEASRGKNKKKLASVGKSCIRAALQKARKGLYETGSLALVTGIFKAWDILVSDLHKRIQNFKPKIKKSSLDSLNSSIRCKFSSDELHDFMEFVRFSLGDLINSLNEADTNMTAEKKLQIETLRQKLNLFNELFSFASERCRSEKELNALRIHLQGWVYKAASLSLLYWVAKEEDGEENNELRLSILLSDLLQKIRPPCNREFTGLCLQVLKASEPSPSQSFLVGALVFNLLVFLLENLNSPLKGRVKNLQSGLVFLVTIFMHPSITKKYGENDKILLTKEHGEDEKSSSTAGNAESILTTLALADAAFDEAPHLIYSLCAGKFSKEIANEKLQSFLEKINLVKEEIRKSHGPILITSSFCFPHTNIGGFTDLLLENLKEILKSELQLSPSAKQEIETVQEELLSLRISFKDFIEQQNEQEQLKDIRTRIFNAPYLVDLAIKSFLYVDNSRGYGMLCLLDVTEEIKFIRGEIKKIQDQQIYKFGELKPAMISSSSVPSAKDNALTIDDDVVGFNDEANTIVELLKKESEQLEIICIYGMAGQGKTTLANKIYNDPSVQLHFHKHAWCCISQDFKLRKVLLEILSHLIEGIGDISRNKLEELEDMLSKCLKGRKYLIVLDDIWDIKVWNVLKNSFPDNNKGSKILFTSRGNLATQGQINCIPHHLRLLTDKESWELLKKKIIAKCSHCPQFESDVGMKIVRKCKGLPLTIVLIAGLLANNVENLDWWNHIEEQLGSRVASEGCKYTLELSYKHLPECLKPCFLYFGSFPEDRVIRVQKLTQLWISERIIRKSPIEKLEHVAREYLMDLVNRSLVIITSRSSNGGIKECCVHDLLHEFCLAKGKEENFLHLIHENGVSHYSLDDTYKHYRLCFHEESWRHSDPPGPFVHSLLFFPAFGRFTDLGEPFFHSLHKYRLLQVLDLEEVLCVSSIPEEITMLVLLRYFAIWCPDSCAYFPRSAAKLVNLEYFRVKGYFNLPVSNGYYFTSAIWSMKNLRYVDVEDSYALSLGDDGAESYLDNIQTFKTIRLSHAGFAKRLLRRIPNVRKLSCHIEIGDGQEDIDQMPSLDSLSQIESLYIHSFHGPKYSFESILPLSLRKLTLKQISLEWSAISTIAMMPNLEVLKLLRNSFRGKRWDVEDDQFLKLKFLKLSWLDLRCWNASDDAFPCLQRLVVEYCRELEEIPSSFGEILTLKRIEVSACRSIVIRSTRLIREQQLDLGNEELQVIIEC